MIRSSFLGTDHDLARLFNGSSTGEIASDRQQNKTRRPSGWVEISVDTSRRCVRTTVSPPSSPWPDGHCGTCSSKKARTACGHPRRTRTIAHTPDTGHRQYHPLRHRPDSRLPHPAKHPIHPTKTARTLWTRLKHLHRSQHRPSSRFAPTIVLSAWG